MGVKYVVLLTTLFFSLSFTNVSAQTADVTKSISEVKRDTSYIYAEATMKDLDESIIGARAILEVKVSDWLRSLYPNENMEMCIAKAKEHSFDIKTRRGDYHRSFVYVKKSDIIPIENANNVLVLQVPTKDKQEKVPSVELLSEEASSDVSIPEKNEPLVSLTTDEEQMVKISQFYGIEPYIKGLQGKGRNVVFGKYATMPKNADCDLFVYNQQGEVVAVLRKESGDYLNLKTLQLDSIDNYKNCGAIWLQLK